ncbi:MAG: SMP-30/gluconolactonase/LRE family protein [Panacagrimonas sp.]
MKSIPLLSLLTAALMSVSMSSHAAKFGDVSVLAQVPAPGFPEGIAVQGNKAYVAGPATLGTAINNQASRVWEFDINSGALTRTFLTEGEQVLGAEHANSCLAFDGLGRLYVLNTQIGPYRLDVNTGVQQSYAPPIPNLNPCPIGSGPQAMCTPTPGVTPPLPNDLAFDDAGNLYVTDSMQAAIFRIPAGGGPAQMWFKDYRLFGPYIGVNGLRISPDRTKVFFTVTNDLLGIGRVYTLPLVDAPTKDDLQVFHSYILAEGPDGIAFGASGRLYVTLALPGQSGISVLNPDGSEFARIKNPLLSPTKPFDAPANLAFDGNGHVLVTNHAFATGLLLKKQFQVLKVFVDDTASPLVAPVLP